jgi:hypothetical protein
MPPVTLFNSILGANFVASSPLLISGEKVVLDFQLNVTAATAKVEWYPEFTSGNPFAPTTIWYRETAEEDIGNGDVRMPLSIRRFSNQGADTDLATGVYNLDAQFRRSHNFVRIQIRGTGAIASVLAPFGEIPTAP